MPNSMTGEATQPQLLVVVNPEITERHKRLSRICEQVRRCSALRLGISCRPFGDTSPVRRSGERARAHGESTVNASTFPVPSPTVLHSLNFSPFFPRFFHDASWTPFVDTFQGKFNWFHAPQFTYARPSASGSSFASSEALPTPSRCLESKGSELRLLPSSLCRPRRSQPSKRAFPRSNSQRFP